MSYIFTSTLNSIFKRECSSPSPPSPDLSFPNFNTTMQFIAEARFHEEIMEHTKGGDSQWTTKLNSYICTHIGNEPCGLELEQQHMHVPKEIQFLICSSNGHILHAEDMLDEPGANFSPERRRCLFVYKMFTAWNKRLNKESNRTSKWILPPSERDCDCFRFV